MRPKSFEEFVGQRAAIEQIKLALSSARARNTAIDHVLLSGPPGLGKTTIAQLIAASSGSRCIETNANIIRTPADVLAQIVNLRDGDVLFLDEIHALPVNVQEFLYPAMEDYRISTISQLNRRAAVTIQLRRFVLVGATTIEGQLTGPMRDRFGIVCRLLPYSESDIADVVRRAARKEGVAITEDSVLAIARRSRSTPRIALKHLRRIRDSAVSLGSLNKIDIKAVEHAYSILRISDLGLTDQDRDLLKALAMTSYSAVGLQALSAAINVTPETVEHVLEPHLMRIGAIERTPRGRRITEFGRGLIGD